MILRPITFLQLPIPFATNVEVCGNVPLGSAAIILHSRALKSEVNLHLVPQKVASRFGDQALIDYLVDISPTHLCLTVTVWNVERSIHIAREVCKKVPDLKVWLGGPEVGEGSILYEHLSVFEQTIEGEGEEAFQNLIEGHSLTSIPLKSLNTVHGAYRSNLVELERDGVMFAEWGRGCKFKCSFCHYHQGRPGGQIVKGRDLVEEDLQWARDNGVREIYLLDPSFEQRKDFRDFLSFLSSRNRPAIPLMVELRAEAIDVELARLLFDCGVRRVETGLQTLTKEALAKSSRHLEINDFLQGVGRLKSLGIDVKTDVMIGLPGDNEAGFIKTLQFLKEHNLHEKIQLFHTQVLPGTKLRSNADRLGISFSRTPPYHILETPTWSMDELDSALSVAEETLQTSFGLEEEPLLPPLNWSKESCFRYTYENVDVAWSLGFDMTKASGMMKLKNEEFDSIGSVFTLIIRVGNDRSVQPDLSRALFRLVERNPFTTLFLVIESEPNVPLNLFDELHELLREHRGSQYCQDFYAKMASCENPQRRLCLLLHDHDYHLCEADWLDELHTFMDVIWCTECSDIEDTVNRAKADLGVDYHFLDVSPIAKELNDMLFRQLAHVENKEQLILPGLETHWSFKRYLAQNDEWDW